MLCLAPVVLIGHLFTVQTDWHQTTNMDGNVIDLQTCESGLGLHGRASDSNLYGLGLHYGFKGEWDDFSVTFQPRVGLSYAAVKIRELPAEKQFELGAQLLFGYKSARIAIDYWHLSNAGLKSPNIGIDTIGILAGWVF